MGSQSFWFFPTWVRIIIAITFSLALVECRRHLCDDMTRPVCPGGAKAVYNRPTGRNTKGSTYFPPPTCPGQGPFGAKPFCEDGSTPAFRFNGCKYEELKCPNGQGKPPHCPGGGPRCDRPFTVCQDGSPCACPGGGKGCAFVHRRCANGDKCHRQCKTGQPHCPWFTKNRNPHNGTRIHNAGPRRPGNKEGGHHWGKDYPGHQPTPAPSPTSTTTSGTSLTTCNSEIVLQDGSYDCDVIKSDTALLCDCCNYQSIHEKCTDICNNDCHIN